MFVVSVSSYLQRNLPICRRCTLCCRCLSPLHLSINSPSPQQRDRSLHDGTMGDSVSPSNLSCILPSFLSRSSLAESPRPLLMAGISCRQHHPLSPITYHLECHGLLHYFFSGPDTNFHQWIYFHFRTLHDSSSHASFRGWWVGIPHAGLDEPGAGGPD